MSGYSMEVALNFAASDHSDATQKATELSQLLRDAGYGHTATRVLDADGELFAVGE